MLLKMGLKSDQRVTCRKPEAANKGCRNNKNTAATLYNVFSLSKLRFALKGHDGLQLCVSNWMGS